MNEQESIGDLIGRLRDDSTALIRDEVALAKTEISEKLSMAGKNGGIVAAGALVGYSALVILLIAIGSLITAGLVEAGFSLAMGNFLGLAIVAIVVGIISAVLIKSALERLKASNLVPERTVQSLKEDKEFAKQQIR